MDIVDRFQRAFQSQFGIVLLGLVVFVLLLLMVYVLMLYRQKKKDLLAYLHRAYYEKASSLANELQFIGTHKADFFGRQTSVKLPEGEWGYCLIPPPEMVDDEVCGRFNSYFRALTRTKLPLFAPYSWTHHQKSLIVVQSKLLRHNGLPFLHLTHYLADKRLGRAYCEEILIEIARALAALHETVTEEGVRLYHGFLLPRSLFIDFDVNRAISQITIADAGLSYAFGANRIHQRLNSLRLAKLPIEKFCASEIVDQYAMLAPEQKDPKLLHEVGPASDFFAFAALAVTMFTQQRFSTSDKVNWDLIPKSWQPFLKACLSDHTTNRPKDFLELQDWLSDPDIALTHMERVGEDESEETKQSSAPDELKLENLADVLHKVQDQKLRAKNTLEKMSEAEKAKFNRSLELGFKALKMSRWKRAEESFTEAAKLCPTHAEVNVSLAIVYYELGDLEKAERHYAIAKKMNPQTARCFREHIAFRV